MNIRRCRSLRRTMQVTSGRAGRVVGHRPPMGRASSMGRGGRPCTSTVTSPDGALNTRDDASAPRRFDRFGRGMYGAFLLWGWLLYAFGAVIRLLGAEAASVRPRSGCNMVIAAAQRLAGRCAPLCLGGISLTLQARLSGPQPDAAVCCRPMALPVSTPSRALGRRGVGLASATFYL